MTVAKVEGRYVDPVGGRRLVHDLYDQWIAERRPFWMPVTETNLMDVARLLDAAVQVEGGSVECGQNVGKPVVKEREPVGIPGE